jgi:DNA polymerase-4
MFGSPFAKRSIILATRTFEYILLFRRIVGLDKWPRVIILIDADAFFASVEIRDNPGLKGKPVIIGAKPGTRGVVSTCSYEARKYGVRSAMPISQAYRLCPHGIFLSPNHAKYSEVSRTMFSIFEKYTPIVERVSVDEGYLDVTPEDGRKIAEKIRAEVKTELGITVTAGVSYCRYLAKIAAEENKPDGLGLVGPQDAQAFLNDLDVAKIPGVGPKTLRILRSHGICKVADLRTMPPTWFETTLGKYGVRLKELSLGIDSTPVGNNGPAKSVSEETTFEVDQTDKDNLCCVLAQLSQDVGFRLRENNYYAKTIGIKVRFSDFTTITRAETLSEPINSDSYIFSTAKTLFLRLQLPMPVRLLGVSASNISRKQISQPMLLQDNTNRWGQISKTLDDLRHRFGRSAISLGATLKPPK